VWIPSQNRFDVTKMALKIKAQMFSLRSCSYLVLFEQVRGNLAKNGAWSASIWKNAPNMKRNAVVCFFWGNFFGVFFGQVWENLVQLQMSIFRGPVTPIKSCKRDMSWIFLTKNVIWEFSTIILYIDIQNPVNGYRY